ncbi:acyl transferase/acyl hydrolase/lysophospholipase [Flagelloscypha sp. PMI_526]|nr:acyl transferase/acyl hydrolase/lysophospholipase [Flagelloscypha sp. PMI_526]
MSSEATGEGIIALSFDHGNIAGHSPLELLEEIMGRLNYDIDNKKECVKWLQKNKRPVRPHDVFDIIGGSGTGGLIAGMLSCMQLDATQALDEYLGLAGLLFPGPPSSRFASSPTSKLEDALKHLVKSHHPSHKKEAPLIGTPAHSSDGFILAHRSLNVRSIPALFRTYRSRNLKETIDCQLWQALRATTADLGTGKLEEVVIKGEKYSGTSIKNGNPTQQLTSELRQRFPTQQFDLVLSLGCGHPETISLPKGTSKDVEKLLKALNKDCEETHETMSRYWMEQSGGTRGATGPYRRLSVAQGLQGMEEKSYSADVCGTVATHSKQYMAQADVSREIDRIVGILEKRMLQKELELHSDLPRLPKLPTAAPISTPIHAASDRKKLLSLDGGGLIGISEMLLLDRVLDGDDKKPCEYFDLIGGCGTGGILAILLVRFEMTVKEAMTTLERLTRPLLPFIKNDETQDTEALTSVFVKELVKVLSELSGENLPKMFPATPKKCKAFVLANALDNLNAKIPRFLGTYKEGRRSMSKTNYSIQDAIRATTAGRNLFLDAIFGEGYIVERFGGTGYANNNPTYHLIEESKRIWPNSPPPYVVSLGAGQVGTIPHPGTREKQELLDVLNKIASNCEDTHEEMSKLLSPELYHRFNVQHGLSDKELWSLMEVEKVTSSTKAYCESVTVASRLESVGEALDEAIGEKVAQGNEVSDWERRMAALEVPA